LGSSRAARRANVRARRAKALSGAAKGARNAVLGFLNGAVGLILLCVLPLLYLTASYFTIDLPLRWINGTEQATWPAVVVFVAAIVVGLVGLARAIQGAPPVVPVRSRFARVMFALSWVAGILMTIGDLASAKL
jgi:uncharacterized integral membrane protein